MLGDQLAGQTADLSAAQSVDLLAVQLAAQSAGCWGDWTVDL